MTPGQREAVVAEAMSWIGTPYHHHGRIKGVGVDCLMLLCEVFERAGVIPRTDPGYYAPEWHLHRSEEIYLEGLLRHGREIGAPQPGDVALWRFGRTFSHAGIMTGEKLLIHSYIGLGVCFGHLDEQPLAGRPVRFFTMEKT